MENLPVATLPLSDSSLPSNYQLPVAPQLWAGPWQPSASMLELLTGFIVCRDPQLLGVYVRCGRVQIAFHRPLPHPTAPTLFPLPLQQRSLEHWSEGGVGTDGPSMA